MALRHILAIPILAWILAKTFKNPKFGVYAFVVILFCTPSSLFWGFEEWRIPLILSLCLFVSTLKYYGDRNRLDTTYSNGMLFWWKALYVVLIISLICSADLQRSFDIFLDKWSKTFLFCWLLMLWIKEEADFKKLYTVIICCFVILALRGVYRYQAGYMEIGGLAGSMMDRNAFALHLMMVFPLAYFMSEIEEDRKRKKMFLWMSAVIAICVAVTFSRMGFLLIVSAGILMMLFTKKKIRFALVAIVVGGTMMLFMPEEYFERMNTIKTYEEDPSAMGRINAWKAGIKMGKDHLITGVGPNCFEIPKVYSRYADDLPHVAHNTYIQLFAEEGIFALICWLMLLLVAIFKCIAGSKNQNYSNSIRAYYKAGMFSLVLYMIGAVFLSAEDWELFYVNISSIILLNSISVNQLSLSGTKV